LHPDAYGVMPWAAALLAFAATCTVHPRHSDHPLSVSSKLPSLLTLRGGAEPAVAAELQPAVATQPSSHRAGLATKVKKKKKKQQSASLLGVRDGVAVAMCLSAVGAVAVGVGGSDCDPLMRMVPQDMRNAAWLLFGGMLSSSLYGIIRVTHADRARAIGAAVGKTVWGLNPAGRSLAHVVSAPAVLFALGSIASCQTLPSFAG